MAARSSDDVAGRRGFLSGAIVDHRWSTPGSAANDPLRDSPATAGFTAPGPAAAGPAAASFEAEHSRRRVLFGRLAAVFYAGSGL